MNEQDLKLALVKILPEKIYTAKGLSGSLNCYWRKDGELQSEIIDTELLHVCWLVEETIVGTDLWGRYLVEMETTPWNELVHATWQQRAAALIKVKGQK